MTLDGWQEWWERHGERELRCILMTAWDPVGAGDLPEAWDEYDDYALGIAHRLRDTSDADTGPDAVAAHLTRIEVEEMEIDSPQRATANGHLATALVAWHEWSYRRGGRRPSEWIDED